MAGHRATTLALLLVVATVATVGGPAAAPVAAQDSDTCMTVVEHDAFRDDPDTVSALANGSSATSTVSNTRVTLEDADAFYRVRAENPNGYCVHYRVFVSEQAMAPASIPGGVESNDGDNYTATWDAVHDWNTSETYTRIEFTLPPDTTASFAPNQYRIKALSWTTEKSSAAKSMTQKLKDSVLGEQPVTKRHYRLSADETEVPTTVTVRLRNPQTGAKISEYHALYSTDGESWQPVEQSTDAPIYKSTPENRSVVRFHFNEPGQVRFVANPSTIDEAEREYASYSAGIDTLVDDYLGGIFGGDDDG